MHGVLRSEFVPVLAVRSTGRASRSPTLGAERLDVIVMRGSAAEMMKPLVPTLTGSPLVAAILASDCVRMRSPKRADLDVNALLGLRRVSISRWVGHRPRSPRFGVDWRGAMPSDRVPCVPGSKAVRRQSVATGPVLSKYRRRVPLPTASAPAKTGCPLLKPKGVAAADPGSRHLLHAKRTAHGQRLPTNRIGWATT